MTETPRHLDVLVVGAGLSGICAAYYLRRECPNKSFMVFEARDAVGGTWDLFRYPGIRSDSDMHTLGFSFFAWRRPKAIADGPSILAYIEETAAHFDLMDSVRLRRRVERAEWSTSDNQWTVAVRDETGAFEDFTCGFLWWCSGYYDYAAGHTPEFAGIDEFAGPIVHPQLWPPDLDWSQKRVVVIGSGATAVTLVPTLAERASHVTMLQRSPTYIIPRPSRDIVASALGKAFGRLGYRLGRWKNIALQAGFYIFSRRFPRVAASLLLGQARWAIGAEQTAKHFTPTYNVWDQRLCLIPDGDLYKAISAGRASVATDVIDHFTQDGIVLGSGESISADIVVTATGLRLQLAGGAEVVVDGVPVNMSEELVYKGAMLSNVPNAAMSVGYTNASWTLKCELISGYVCRLLRFMDEHDFVRCVPVRPESEPTAPLIDFNSGYVIRALDDLPSQGTHLPWRLYQNYLLDNYLFRRRPIDDGALSFS